MWHTEDDLLNAAIGKTKRTVIMDGANILLSDSTPTASILRTYYNILTSSGFKVIVVVNQRDQRLAFVDNPIIVPTNKPTTRDVQSIEMPKESQPTSVYRSYITSAFQVPNNALDAVEDRVIEAVMRWMRFNFIRPYKEGGKRALTLDDVIAVFYTKVYDGVLLSRDQFKDIARLDRSRCVRDLLRERLITPVAGDKKIMLGNIDCTENASLFCSPDQVPCNQ